MRSKSTLRISLRLALDAFGTLSQHTLPHNKQLGYGFTGENGYRRASIAGTVEIPDT